MGPKIDPKELHAVKIVCQPIMTYKTILDQLQNEKTVISNGTISKIKDSVEKRNQARNLMVPHSSNACSPNCKKPDARCLRKERVVSTFYSETFLKFPKIRRFFIDSWLTDGYISLWPTNLRNLFLYLTQSSYLIFSLAGFICLCVTWGGNDVELFCLLNFVGLEMQLISVEIVQEINTEQDVVSDAIYFDRNYLQYCPAVGWKISDIYFYRSNQCQASTVGYPQVWDTWVSLVHKNAGLVVSVAVTLFTAFFCDFDSEIGAENG
ncbi:hypothetical protein Fcan01_24831 [Folsomia candida]|uniref:Uncharacterized protein n=1 Tax=Folsomia candida TaxID=158441 RepID=A0A226D475_FOLCA|nr:hypothetical protein Fcan01_24831 [Folsomia candida]